MLALPSASALALGPPQDQPQDRPTPGQGQESHLRLFLQGSRQSPGKSTLSLPRWLGNTSQPVPTRLSPTSPPRSLSRTGDC